jgi:hypothetical protein
VLFERLPRVNGLDPGMRAVAYELVLWREEAAREGDRPASSVLQDAALVEIAKRRPSSPERLAQIRGLHEGILRRRGAQIVAAVQRGREREPIPSERERPAGTEPEDAPLITLAESLVRTRALERELAYELSPPAPTCSASSPRSATAGRSRTCGPSRAGGGRSSAPSCSSSWPATARCAWAPAGASRSPGPSPRGRSAPPRYLGGA